MGMDRREFVKAGALVGNDFPAAAQPAFSKPSRSNPVSERTVETHRTNILGKLLLKDHAELVRFAIGNGSLRLG
jgi:hypothetical protein